MVEAAEKLYALTDADCFFSELCQSVSGFMSLANNVYHYKDFYINVGKRFVMACHAGGLEAVSKLGLSCVPELIAYIWLDNGEDMVLVTRVKGSENRRIVPCDSRKALPETTRRRLLSDAERLMDKNYAVVAMAEKRSEWYILEDESMVVFSNCELASVSDEAKAVYHRIVLKELELN